MMKRILILAVMFTCLTKVAALTEDSEEHDN